jgi:hypothetical protein
MTGSAVPPRPWVRVVGYLRGVVATRKSLGCPPVAFPFPLAVGPAFFSVAGRRRRRRLLECWWPGRHHPTATYAQGVWSRPFPGPSPSARLCLCVPCFPFSSALAFLFSSGCWTAVSLTKIASTRGREQIVSTWLYLFILLPPNLKRGVGDANSQNPLVPAAGHCRQRGIRFLLANPTAASGQRPLGSGLQHRKHTTLKIALGERLKIRTCRCVRFRNHSSRSQLFFLLEPKYRDLG